MNVIYHDPDDRPGTYHPQLGYLKSGKPFDLPDGEAEKYISAGLLTEVEESPKPETGNSKQNTAPIESGMNALSDESEIQQGEEV